MEPSLSVPLHTTADQFERLEELQQSFAQVCNALAPVVQERKLWHRVTLHHLTYRSLREQFPALGSQMVCNAIYSVCRTARVVYQNPASPFGLAAMHGAPLPLLHFRDTSPVFLDRHTASVRAGVVSIFTLAGRIHCRTDLGPIAEARFHAGRLRELVLDRTLDGQFELQVDFGAPAGKAKGAARLVPAGPPQIPHYIRVGTSA
jgi:hypothetical protein